MHIHSYLNDAQLMNLSDLHAQLLAPPTREELVPPPRFQTSSFASYHIDQQIDGLAAVVSQIHAFAQQRARRWWQWSRRSEKPGLYLDGDFGVGKTHLLAAMFHANPGSGTYCSFAEAISLAIVQGPEQAVKTLAADLVCIDEFELDDPSNTRLADLLVDGLIKAGCRIAVTSNTVPGELGQGRMSVDKFRDQLVRIATAFQDVHVPGHDYRQRARPAPHKNPHFWAQDCPAFPQQEALSLSMEELDSFLITIPIINLRRVAQQIPYLYIRDLVPCKDQLIGLRLVHIVDKLYDFKSQLRVQTDIDLEDLFLPEYRDWAFAKKYRRCSSRLAELCADLSQESAA